MTERTSFKQADADTENGVQKYKKKARTVIDIGQFLLRPRLPMPIQPAESPLFLLLVAQI